MADSKIENLSVDLLVTNAGTQMRAKVDDDTVEQYYDLWREKHEFPPLDVFSDGETFWVADGFHRLYGAQKAKRASVPCRIRKGTLRDAILFACGANHDHGLHRSRADKRVAVEALLDDGEWGKRSQQWVAEACKVSRPFVSQVVTDRKPSVLDSLKGATLHPGKVEGKDGKEYPARKVGKPPSKSDSSGKDDSTGKKPQEPPPEPSRSDTDKPGDFGTCPNCGGKKWTEDEFGAVCAKCNQPHGEPAGGVDEDLIGTQRAKSVKTVEALMRAVCDLHRLLPKPKEQAHLIAQCKLILTELRAWK